MKKRFIVYLGCTIVGLLGGYAYYYFVGCATGTCAISSNPYLSTIYGGALGFLLSYVVVPSAKKKKDAAE